MCGPARDSTLAGDTSGAHESLLALGNVHEEYFDHCDGSSITSRARSWNHSLASTTLPSNCVAASRRGHIGIRDGGGAIRFAAAQSVLWADQLVPDADWIGLTVMAKPLSRAVLPNDIISLDGRPVAIATEAPRSITDNTKLMNSLVGPPPYLRADFLVLVKRQHFAAVRKHLATQGVAVDGRNWAAVKSRFVDAVDPESSISLILNWMHKHAKDEYSWQPTAHTQESSLTGTTPTTMASLVAGLTPVQKLFFKSREKIWQAGSDIPATTTTDLSTVSHRPGSGYPGHEPTPTTSPCYADYTPGPLSISSICCGQAGKHNRKDLDRSKSCPTWRRKCRGYTANVVMGACEATDADGRPPTPPFP